MEYLPKRFPHRKPCPVACSARPKLGGFIPWMESTIVRELDHAVRGVDGEAIRRRGSETSPASRSPRNGEDALIDGFERQSRYHCIQVI